MNNTTQMQYESLIKQNRHTLIEIGILNKKDDIIDNLIGKVIDGSITLNSNSTYRRTGNLETILVDDLLPEHKNSIWFNRRINIRIGLKHKGDVVWFQMGRFAIKSININKSNTRNISFELLDYMAFLDGTLYGGLSHDTTLSVEEGVKTNEAIYATVKDLPKVSIDILQVDGVDSKIPYDLEFNATATTYDVIKTIIDLYMGQQFYFDEFGQFIVSNIPNKKDDPVVWKFDESNIDLSTSLSRSIDMSNVKNDVWVWGGINKDTGKQYYYNIRNEYSVLQKDDMYQLSATEGSMCFVLSNSQTFLYTNNKWVLQGYTIPYTINIQNIGQRVTSVNDNSIMSDNQAVLRAEYEIKERSDLAETISLSTIPIYIIKPNTKIYIKHKDVNVDGEYIVNSINIPLNIDGEMTIQAEKLY